MTTHKKTIKRLRCCACVFTIASIALLGTGCKRKQEVIDLSGARTSTVQAPSESSMEYVEESKDSASSLTLDTPEMNTDNSPSEKGIRAMMETYMNNKVFIQYPVVQDLNDADRTAAVNALLKENALSILAGWGLNEAKDTLEMTCKVISADQSRIIVTYKGYCYPNQAAHPTNFFLTNTVDLSKISNVRLKDYADPSLLADYVCSDNVVLSNANPANQTEILDFIKSVSKDQYIGLFENADFGGTAGFPDSFSYESDGDIYVTIPVAHALGDYVTVIYTPENK